VGIDQGLDNAIQTLYGISEIGAFVKNERDASVLSLGEQELDEFADA